MSLLQQQGFLRRTLLALWMRLQRQQQQHRSQTKMKTRVVSSNMGLGRRKILISTTLDFSLHKDDGIIHIDVCCPFIILSTTYYTFSKNPFRFLVY